MTRATPDCPRPHAIRGGLPPVRGWTAFARQAKGTRERPAFTDADLRISRICIVQPDRRLPKHPRANAPLEGRALWANRGATPHASAVEERDDRVAPAARDGLHLVQKRAREHRGPSGRRPVGARIELEEPQVAALVLLGVEVDG